MLGQAGYRVIGALGPQQALELASTDKPDLVLTDIVMPGLPGPVLADRLRGRFPGLPILFMSGYARDRHGAADPVDPAHLILKPFTHDELVARVESILAEGAARPHRASKPPET